MKTKRDFAIIVDDCRLINDYGEDKVVIYGDRLCLELEPDDWRESYIDYEGEAFFVTNSGRRSIQSISFYCPMQHPYPKYSFVVRSGHIPQGRGLLTNRKDCRSVYEGEVDFDLTSISHLPLLRKFRSIGIDSPANWFGVLDKRRDWFLRHHWTLRAWSFGGGQISVPEKVYCTRRYFWGDETIDDTEWVAGVITKLKS